MVKIVKYINELLYLEPTSALLTQKMYLMLENFTIFTVIVKLWKIVSFLHGFFKIELR